MQSKSDKLAYWMLKNFNKAIYQFKMIEDGDRIAVAVSGGKDSLTLLNLLAFRQPRVREKYEILVIHISGDSQGPILPVHPPLINWLENHDYPFVVEELCISDTDNIPLNCHRCSRNRKKQIFEIARRNGCNVVALGHHADDFAQTTLLNLLFHGRLETMSPSSSYFGDVFRLIRPLCFLTEKEISTFARVNNFPVSPRECIRSKQTQRYEVKIFLESIQKQFPNIRDNLIKAGLSDI